ncbi:MAG: hypothetical protein ACK5MK_13905 [Dysgonomonas sp.]
MKKSNIITSIYALLTGARVNVVGQLFGSEIIAILFFPYTKTRQIFRQYPILKKISLAYFLLLLSLIFSDLVVNNTAPEDFLRGWANIIFSFLTVVFLTYYLSKNEKNIPIYLFFAAISFFIFRPELIMSEHEGETSVFKFYYMFGVNFFILILSYFIYNKNKRAALILLFSYSIFCLIFDSRSNGAIYFISALAMTIKTFNIKLNKLRITAFAILIILFSYIGYVIYVNEVLAGKFTGNNTQQLRQVENPYNPISLLEVGRAEFFFEIDVDSKKPIFGYGSWAEDKTGNTAKLFAKMIGSNSIDDSNLIPSHSILLTAWLWAGIGGLIAIMIIYCIIYKQAFYLFYRSKSSILVVIIPLALDQLWNFFFSPIGHLRQTAPLIFALIIIEYYNMQKEENTKL